MRYYIRLKVYLVSDSYLMITNDNDWLAHARKRHPDII